MMNCLTKRVGLRFWTLTLAAVTSSPAQATQCDDTPVIFTISSTYTDPTTNAPYTAGIRSDGMGDYVNGQSGVDAFIRSCGTGDATLQTGRRSFTLDLRNVVDTNSSTPPFASAPVAGIFLNIRNVLYNYNPTGTYSFTTRVGSQLASPNVDYNFRFENPADQAFSLPPSNSNANTPCVTSLVNVVHYPATSSSKETWIAWSDSNTAASCSINGMPLQVGTLLLSKTSPATNAGQFTVPFYITVRRQ